MKQRPFSSWSHHRPRLLIEDPSPALELAEFRSFQESAFEVALCSGPCEEHDSQLTAGCDRPLVDGADVVLMGPGMGPYRAEVPEASTMARLIDLLGW